MCKTWVTCTDGIEQTCCSYTWDYMPLLGHISGMLVEKSASNLSWTPGGQIKGNSYLLVHTVLDNKHNLIQYDLKCTVP